MDSETLYLVILYTIILLIFFVLLLIVLDKNFIKNFYIIGNPKWNHYCYGKGVHKTKNCDTGCKTNKTPIGNVCCSKACCKK